MEGWAFLFLIEPAGGCFAYENFLFSTCNLVRGRWLLDF